MFLKTIPFTWGLLKSSLAITRIQFVSDTNFLSDTVMPSTLRVVKVVKTLQSGCFNGRSAKASTIIGERRVVSSVKFSSKTSAVFIL